MVASESAIQKNPLKQQKYHASNIGFWATKITFTFFKTFMLAMEHSQHLEWHKSKWLKLFLKTFSPFAFPSILPIVNFQSCKWKCASALHFSTNCRTFIEIQWFQPDCHSRDVPGVKIEFSTRNFPILGFLVFSCLFWNNAANEGIFLTIRNLFGTKQLCAIS